MTPRPDDRLCDCDINNNRRSRRQPQTVAGFDADLDVGLQRARFFLSSILLYDHGSSVTASHGRLVAVESYRVVQSMLAGFFR